MKNTILLIIMLGCLVVLLRPKYEARPPLMPQCIHTLWFINPKDVLQGIEGYQQGLCLSKDGDIHE